MTDLWQAWQDLDVATQAVVIAAVARMVVGIARRFGLDCRPDLESVLAAAGLGALAGYATGGDWQHALMGVVAGLAGTGVYEAQKGAARYGEDRALLEAWKTEQKLP